MNKINKLRNLMKENKIDIYYVPTDDFHGSEFVGAYFKAREYLSDFTGSAGTLIVTMEDAGLWTDGRYYLQAEEELSEGEIVLYKAGMENVKTINQFLQERLSDGMTLGFDGRCLTASSIIGLKRLLKNNGKKINICDNVDLVDCMWDDRPKLSVSEAFELEEKYIGESAVSKIKRLRNKLKDYNAFAYVLTSLDDIAWLLNIRAHDIKCSPLLLSYMIITDCKATLYCNKESVKMIDEYLTGIGIEVKNYNDIYEDAENIPISKNGKLIIADLDKVNYTLYNKIKKNRIYNIVNPTTVMKAIKNNVEVVNEAEAHIKDGIAYIRFLHWFSQNKSKKITELDIAVELLKQRQNMEGFIEESFEPIVAYGKHGAIVHYSPTKKSNIKIDNKSFVLIDTGAHYYEGTTDITRTLSCGDLDDEEKKNYTLVLKGNLALGAAKFVYGTTGSNLDILAREPLWNEGLDYNHSTGHGVGYLMNVHEGPNNIRWKFGKGKTISCAIEPGMITSNEPGLYLSEKYGIRLENMIVCKEREKNEYGRFLEFETLTLVPFDINAIDVKLLSEKEKNILNEYHKKIYKVMCPFLNEEEQRFLLEITREIN